MSLPASPGRSKPATGSPDPVPAVVDEREHVHNHLAVRVGCSLVGQPPDPLADFGPGPPDGHQSAGAGCGQRVDEAGDCWIGPARTLLARPATRHHRPDSRRPARRRGRGPRILPGSCTALGLRHGASARDSASARPVRRAVSTSRAPPACETTRPPLSGSRTRGYDPIRLLTRRVPLSLVGQDPGQALSSQLSGDLRDPARFLDVSGNGSHAPGRRRFQPRATDNPQRSAGAPLHVVGLAVQWHGSHPVPGGQSPACPMYRLVVIRTEHLHAHGNSVPATASAT